MQDRPTTDAVQSRDHDWLRAQLTALAEDVQFAGLLVKVTPEQFARLLREVCQGRDWRHGGWK